MPLIKKFQVNYEQIPEVFSLPPEMYLSTQTKQKKEGFHEIINQIDLDLDRTSYVDFEGRKASELKAIWLTHSIDKKNLAKGVFPLFIQGVLTGACIGEIIYQEQFVIPIVQSDPGSCLLFTTTNTSKICFSYKNANDEPAGFSLVVSPNGIGKKEYIGWIISTIQNTTKRPADKKITVLGTQNYITSDAQSTFDAENYNQLLDDLKDAINNDKIFSLIKGIFNPNGSLNEEYIIDLKSRIISSENIDHRDMKQAQLNCLFDLCHEKQIDLDDFESNIRIQIDKDINFFKNGDFEVHLQEVLDRIALEFKKQLVSNKSLDELSRFLKNISQQVANIEQFAEKEYREIELVNIYKALAAHIKAKATTIQFDETTQDEKIIKCLGHYNSAQIHKKVQDFYSTSSSATTYKDKKKQSCLDFKAAETQLIDTIKSSLVGRKSFILSIGFILSLAVATSVSFALTGLLPAFTIVLIAAAATVLTACISIGVGSYFNESSLMKKRAHDVKQLEGIRKAHEINLNGMEQKFQKSIDLDLFLIPETSGHLEQVSISKDSSLTNDPLNIELDTSSSEESDSEAPPPFPFWEKIIDSTDCHPKEPMAEIPPESSSKMSI